MAKPKKQKVDAVMIKDCDDFITTGVWDYGATREWDDVAGNAGISGKDVHVGRIFAVTM